MSAAKQADISATAADTFHENGIAFDEENGVSAVAANNINANTGPTLASTSPTNGKSRMGWIVGGTAALLFIIGLSVGLTNNKNDNSNNKEVAANAEQVGAIATEPRSSDDLGGIFSSDDTDNGTVREEGTLSNNPFIPETDVGDSAMMTWPQYEEAIASTTSSPTTLSPTPARSGVPSTMPSTSDPTKSPSGSPSRQPTFEPSNSPSKGPSLEPTKSPTDEPTKSPSTSPSSSPSKEPTPKPSTSPTLKPTSEPSKQPTSRPTTSPSKRPTSEPTKKPTNQPTNQPTSEPTNKPTTPQPTSRPTPEPTNEPSDPPTTSEPFFFGEDFYTDEDLGIEVSRGLNVRLIARTGRRVKYANGDESKLDYHTKSDAAGIIPMNPDDPTGDDGYVYVTNSEEGDGDGGVYGLYFDKDGNILDYKALLTGTTDNCGGGISPWNTFISCEEYEGGQCWQIDPVNGRTEKTKLGGSGGRYESVAVDNRNPDSPVFFTTEDHEEGAMRRFVADGSGWDALHSNGDTTFLNILGDGEFEWTDDEDDGRDSASEYFPNTEGVQFHDGKLYFMAKKIQRLIILDLDNMTYETEGTGKKFYGEGSFGDQPDQNFFGPTQKLMYFTEDGGDSPGVYARSGSDGTYFTMFQAIKGGMHSDDETIGIALSPDHKRFYAGIQDNGYIFEFTREDGQTFE